jgi:hypothetical protein
MKKLIGLLLVAVLSACGGGNEEGGAGAPSGPVLKALLPSASSGVENFWSVRADYTISSASDGVTISGLAVRVKDNVGADGLSSFTAPTILRFRDLTVAVNAGESNAGRLYRLYRAAFNREPDPQGLGSWMSYLGGGGTLESTANLFITSPEAIQRYGANPSNSEFVNLLYRNVLGREPDPEGFQNWINYLASGAGTRSDALIQFSESAEHKAARAPLIQNGIPYLEVNRPAALPGPSGMVQRVFSGVRRNYAVTQAGESVVVRDAVGRDGTTTIEGPAILVFADIAVAVQAQTTNPGKLLRLYGAALGRLPDSQGLGRWISEMDRGASLESVAGQFMASTEFAAKYGSGLSNGAFVELLYQNVLHRSPDPDGLSAWTNRVASPGVTRASVLADFSESAENRNRTALDTQNGVAFNIYRPGGLRTGLGYVIQRVLTFSVLTPETLAVTAQSSCGQGFRTVDLDPNGVLIAAGIDGTLYEVDPSTAKCSRKGKLPTIGALAVSPQGIIYAAAGLQEVTPAGNVSMKFYTIRSSGSLTAQPEYTAVYLSGATAYLVSMDMAPDGELYGIGIAMGGGYALMKVDKYTGVTSFVTMLSTRPERDIDIDTNGRLVGMAGTELVSLDYKSGALLSVRAVPSFTAENTFSAIAFVP